MVVNERLKKIYALALQGVEGEKERAEKILANLLKKYNVTLDELDENIIKEFVLEYHGEEQRRILMQTIYKVTNDADSFNSLIYTRTARRCRTKLSARCTEAQKIEIEFLFDFYKKLWEKEKEALLFAFFQKHRIFGQLKDGQEETKLSKEELLKLKKLMDGLSDEQPFKQIESGLHKHSKRDV